MLRKIEDLEQKNRELEKTLRQLEISGETEPHLSAIVESSEDAIIGMELDGTILNWNLGAWKVYGYSSEEMIGKNIALLFPKDRVYEREEFIGKVRKGRHVERFKTIRKRKDGTEINVSLTISPIKGKKGAVIGVSTIARDITERKKYEKELKASEKRYREAHRRLYSIIEFLPDPTFVLSKERKVIAWNKALEDITGVSKSEALDKGDYEYARLIYGEKRPIIADLIWEDILEEIKKDYVYIKEYNEIYYAEAFVQNINRGRGAYVWITATPIYDDTGNISGAIECVRDISEMKKMEVKVLQAKRMETIAQLSAGVAHEVRNPLNSIIALVEVLKQEFNETEEYKIYLEQIELQVQRLANLMEDLLDLGKTSRKESFTTVSVVDMIKTAVNLWKDNPESGDREIRISYLPSIVGSCIKVDTSRFQQVIINLLDNAAQHSPEESRIRIGVTETGDWICISVTDRGSGISEENLKKIFEPFFTMRRKGSGLGLSIVNNIVKDHGGSVNIFNNEPPPGCTAEINLPASHNLEEQ